ncbi:hypothetical protein [Pseudomonas mucidolens]|uniref:hypothetical protein n=1 Tax=Pseudomonas mucidolens TaxID=46679 RepID=UPI003BB5E7BA
MNTLVRINWIARGSLAFMFTYHGLVPKLLWLSQGERAMIQAHGIEQVQVFATQCLADCSGCDCAGGAAGGCGSVQPGDAQGSV